jgi:thiol-disulfide isomerase/thioredoxin
MEFVKIGLSVAILILVLQVTGLSDDVSYLSQSVIMKTGLLDADARSNQEVEDFNFDFMIKDLQGNKIPFDRFKGKVVFLNMWATWCGPCRAEMSSIQDLYSTVRDSTIVFVMLSIDKDQDHDKIVHYIASKSYTFPVYQPSQYLPRQLHIPSIPTTFVISKAGKIAALEVGATNYNTSKFKKFINGLATQ